MTKKKDIKVSKNELNKLAQQHSEIVKLVKRLKVISNHQEFRSLYKFIQIKALLNEWNNQRA